MPSFTASHQQQRRLTAPVPQAKFQVFVCGATSRLVYHYCSNERNNNFTKMLRQTYGGKREQDVGVHEKDENQFRLRITERKLELCYQKCSIESSQITDFALQITTFGG